jgi:hypothetical protein
MHMLPRLGIVLSLAGCASLPGNAGDPASVSEVVQKIKADLEVYQRYDAAAAAARPQDDACHGLASFAIEKVKVALTTRTEDTRGASVSASAVLADVKIGPGFDRSERVRGAQTLTFTLYPAPPSPVARASAAAPAEIEPVRFPIAAALQRLRDGLLEASRKPPCVALAPHDEDGTEHRGDAGTVDFDFVVVNDRSGDAGLKLLVFSAGVDAAAHREAANSITVTFRPRGGAAALR